MTLVLANILHRKVRSLISVFAVAIGVTLLLVLVGMTRGSINEVASRIQNVGGDMIVQQAGSTNFFGLKNGIIPEKYGQLIAEAGETTGIDTTSLASLTAGSIAATGGLAKIIGEEDFPVHFHQGVRDNLHVTLVARRVILVVVFDDRSSLGLVRLRVKKAGNELAKILEEMLKKSEADRAVGDAGSPFSEITDDDIDNLFSD